MPVAIEHDLKCRCPLCWRIDGRHHRQAAFCVGPRLQERPRDRRNLATLERGRSTQQAFGNRDVVVACKIPCAICQRRSEEHTSELQSLMRISYAVFCLKKKKN